MNLDAHIRQLSDHTKIICGLLRGMSAAQAAWKPGPADWSALEVINHLADEEREDFRSHLQTILAGPAAPWAPIDPQGWVTQRDYNRRDLAESLARFLDERRQSLAWLPELADADWDAAYSRPWGVITAGDMLAAWVAHDLLHIRQLVALRWHYLVAAVAPRQVHYAGEW